MTDLSTNIGWTAQSGVGFIHEVADPGQTFKEHELPHPEVQRASGINPDLYRQAHGLYVEESDVERLPFVGTETGLEPAEGLLKTGNVESYVTSPPEPEEGSEVWKTVGGSDKGLERPRTEHGHILFDPHAGGAYHTPDEAQAEAVSESAPVENNE